MISKKQIQFNIFLATLLTTIIPIVLGYIINKYLSSKYINIPLHSGLEVTGGVIAIVISLIFYIKYSKNFLCNHFYLSTVALLIMGIIDIFHGISMPGETFVWLHSTAVFFGGIFFMAIWLKEKPINSKIYNFIPIISIFFAVVFSLVSITFSENIPSMINENKTFTFEANLLNIIGGIGFFVAAFKFFIIYYKQKKLDDLLFFILTTLFGISGLLFSLSSLWDIEWWLWHFLRFFAYTTALYFLYKEFFNEIKTIEKTNDKLKNANLIIRESYKQIDTERIKYHSLMNLSSDALFIMDKKGNLLEYSKKTMSQLGYNEQEMSNLTVFDWDKSITLNEYKKIVNLLDDKNSMIFERTFTRKDKTTYTAQISAVNIQFNNKNYIYVSTRDITEQKKRFENIKKVLDLQNNIIVLLDKNQITYANNKFFEFFNQYKNLDEFIKKNKDITNLFIQDERFFYKEKIINNESWIDTFSKLPEKEQIIALLNPNSKIHAFNLHLSLFDENIYILTFNDITETKLELLNLEEKIIRDKLTSAYNREYFEQNYKRLITDFTKKGYKFALALLDIDHFKKVNDTFGHDTGDYVLKHFVETIVDKTRDDDILIRWGGEEFILIFKVKHSNDVTIVLEKIRQIIENIKFDKVGKKTCSIGATLYKDNELIKDTIKRADIAVYEAKETGRNKVVINL